VPKKSVSLLTSFGRVFTSWLAEYIPKTSMTLGMIQGAESLTSQHSCLARIGTLADLHITFPTTMFLIILNAIDNQLIMKDKIIYRDLKRIENPRSTKFLVLVSSYGSKAQCHLELRRNMSSHNDYGDDESMAQSRQAGRIQTSIV
jgi:hypothetical protein